MGTAAVQGRLWGARTADYANLVEGFFSPAYETVFDAAGVGARTRLLDLGCGPGLALQLAARRGAQVAGLDAAAASLALAQARTPAGDFRVGDLQALPWPDASFDVVTSFNAVQFAADLGAALGEARRVVKPGGYVAVLVWGPDEACQTLATMAALRRLLPPPPSSAAVQPLWSPGRLEALLEQAGLRAPSSGTVECSFAFADRETAVCGLMSAGISVATAQQVGDAAVRRAIEESLAAFRTAGGGVQQLNTFHYVVARA